MDMDSISALLEALKRGDAGKGLDLPGGDDAKPIAAKVSILKAVPMHGDPMGGDDDDEHALDLHGMDDDAMGPSDEMHDDSDAGADARDNAQIVAGLQTMYPEIYDKICKTVLGDSGSDQDADMDDRMGGF
jgi:hypothetical protein